MENYASPLQKYKRQPKLYIDLPSKGIWYPKEYLEKAEELEVYSMTANDEIGLKTPDALYSGVAIKKLIESCVPGIKDAWYVPIVDLDYILAAIRLASFGPTIEMNNQCTECQTKDTYGLEIQKILDHLQLAKPEYEIVINNFKFKVRPLCYKEVSQLQQKIFQIRRTLQQYIMTMEENEEKETKLNELYDQLKDYTFEGVCSAVTEITTPDGESENKKQFILDFIKNGDKDFYNKLSVLFEENRKSLSLPETTVVCSGCGHSSNVNPDLDYANFFAQG